MLEFHNFCFAHSICWFVKMVLEHADMPYIFLNSVRAASSRSIEKKKPANVADLSSFLSLVYRPSSIVLLTTAKRFRSAYIVWLLVDSNITQMTAVPIPYPRGAIYQRFSLNTAPINPTKQKQPHNNKTFLNCITVFTQQLENIKANPINKPHPK